MHNEAQSKKMESLLAPLAHLAFHKEASVEDIAKQTGKNYSTILRAISELNQNKFVSFRLQRTSPRGKELRLYAITFYGLVFYYQKTRSLSCNVSEMREIAKTHEEMLIVFKKWEKFASAGYERELFGRILQAFYVEFEYNVAYYSFVVLSTVGIKFRREDEALRRNAFDCLVLGFFYMNRLIDYVKEAVGKENWNALVKIWRVVADDYELRKKRNEFLDYLAREHQETGEAIVEWMKYLKADQEKPA
jgi:hypothetical protein